MRAVFGFVALDGGELRWQRAPVGPTQRRSFGYMVRSEGSTPAALDEPAW